MTENMPSGMVIHRDGCPPLSEARVVVPLKVTVLDPDRSTKLLYLPRP